MLSAVIAAALARCTPEPQFYGMIEVLERAACIFVRHQPGPGATFTAAGSDIGHRQLQFLEFLQTVGDRFAQDRHRAADTGAFGQEIPAQVLHLEESKGQIAAGYDADLILLNADLQVQQTWIGGAVADAPPPAPPEAAASAALEG